MDNKKARAIQWIAWIEIIGGIIGSFILGKTYQIITVSSYSSYVDKTYNWAIAVAGIIISIVSGVIFLGFAEIIILLQEKVNQSVKIEELLKSIKTSNDFANTKTTFEIDELPSL